jgi:hypothetical protein
MAEGEGQTPPHPPKKKTFNFILVVVVKEVC